MRRTVNLGVRINLPGMWGGQFGIGSDSPQVVDTLRRALADPFVELRALHFHRGLTIRDGDTMQHYLASVLDAVTRLRAQTGWHPALLDIGGSLACPTVAAIPRRQFRLNRALGADLLPPDPGDTLALGDAARLAAKMVADHFAKAEPPTAPSDPRAGPGAHRRHPTAAHDRPRREGRRRAGPRRARRRHQRRRAGPQRVPPAVQRVSAGAVPRRRRTDWSGRSARRPTCSTTTGDCPTSSPATCSPSWTPARTSCPSRPRSRFLDAQLIDALEHSLGGVVRRREALVQPQTRARPARGSR